MGDEIRCPECRKSECHEALINGVRCLVCPCCGMEKVIETPLDRLKAAFARMGLGFDVYTVVNPPSDKDVTFVRIISGRDCQGPEVLFRFNEEGKFIRVEVGDI